MPQQEGFRSGSRLAVLLTVVIGIPLAMLGYRHNLDVAAKDGPAEAFRVESHPAVAANVNVTPVLVELFTSEGCSDCPPADTLLAHLQQDQPIPSANIIALEEHVDYWDHLGWHDPFSSHEATVRQMAYTQRLHLDDNYTPQMIVDGTEQFVGSDSAHALRAITSATRISKLAITLSPISFSGSHASGAVSVSANPAAPSNADLYAALVQRSATTNVLRGENGGHTLHHVSTVLAMEKVGTLHKAATPISFSLNIPKNDSAADLAVVVFAQQPSQGAILGVAASIVGPAH